MSAPRPIPPKTRKKPWFTNRQILIGVVALFASAGILLGNLSFYAARSFRINAAEDEFSPFSPENPSTGAASRGAIEESLEEIPSPKWDGTTRVTMLVMGIDYRDYLTGSNASRTDTMILLTVDPVSKTAGMLTIPRDLWVSIPGFSPQKINTAHYFGQLYNYPGGGPALAMETVENTIGVPIDYYARIDFNTFIRFIDLISGVKVEVKEPIELELIHRQLDMKLEPGTYTLGGDAALAYARNRYTGGGDFERSERQMQIIMAIRDRLLNPKIFALLVGKAPELYEEFKSGIATNLSFDDALELAYLATQIETEDITSAVIGPGDYTFGTSPDDLSIAIPVPDKIREKRDLVFTQGGPFTPALTGEPLVLMQLENASISLLNASSDPSLGDRTAEYFRSFGANVVSVGQAQNVHSRSSITDYAGSPYALAYFVTLLNVPSNLIYHRFDPQSSYRVEIVLGNDWIGRVP